MKTKSLTEAAVLSALLVVSSITAIYTGIAYTMYLDMVVPIFICLTYIRLGYKYTILTSITSLLIVSLAIGDIPSAIWMTQGIIMGLICGYFIIRKGTIFDDFFYSAICGCFIMVLIDIYFSKLTGYSFIKDFDSYKVLFPTVDEKQMEILFSILVASLPISTILVVYIGTLFIGKKLNILNKYTNEKYIIIKNFKKYGSYICCSKKTYFVGILYLLLYEVLKSTAMQFNFVYFNIVTGGIRIVVIYFILKDSFSFVMNGLSSKYKSKGFLQLFWITICYMLLVNFKYTFIILVVFSLIINYFMNLREMQINILDKIMIKKL